MSGRQLLFFLLFSSITLTCLPQQPDTNDERLKRLVNQYGQADVEVHPATNDAELLFLNTSVYQVRDGVISVSLSPLTVEWFIGRRFDYKIIEKRQVRSIEYATDVKQAMQWDAWPSYAQYDSIMRSFVQQYPLLCRLDTIGTSIYGRLILVLKISDNPSKDEDEPEVFYSSTIHGDEPPGFVLMLRFCDYLLKNYSASPRIKNMVDNLQIWINPLANPDGTYRNGNTMTNPTRFNANGYDLNRNFPDPLQPYSDTFKMQKETSSMSTFLRERRFVLSANFHSGAEVVNYPWDRYKAGIWEKVHADENWFNTISRAYADTVHKYSPAGYMTDLNNGVTRGYLWYPVFGGRQDFITWELQGREVTIELNNDKIPLPSKLESLWQNNFRSLLGYIENAIYGVHGKVRDEESSKPVSAKVFIKEYDKDSSHVYSDTLTGSFVRMLSAGTWNLSFAATGYRDTTITGLNVQDYQPTELTVYMKKNINPVDTINPTATILYPNPASSEINVLFPRAMAGSIRISIYTTTGMLIADYNAIAVAGIPLMIDVGRFAPGVYTVIFKNDSKGMIIRARFVIIR